MPKTTRSNLVNQNLRLVKRLYPTLSRTGRIALYELTRSLRLSVSQGEIISLDGKWFVTSAGLLRVALRRGCRGIRTVLQERQSDPLSGRWVFKATVFRGEGSKGFVGYGDADPSNVSPLVRGAEMRVAETRAVNRALRKAYGIGLCSVEELGNVAPRAPQSFDPQASGSNGNGSGRREPRLRDRLCLLIRQHNLDPSLVKAYAADFCGTPVLKDASRERVESFIAHLAQAAQEDRGALICKLNSYAQPAEVKS